MARRGWECRGPPPAKLTENRWRTRDSIPRGHRGTSPGAAEDYIAAQKRVFTSAYPCASRRERRSAMGTLLRPPTFTPFRSARMRTLATVPSAASFGQAPAPSAARRLRPCDDLPAASAAESGGRHAGPDAGCSTGVGPHFLPRRVDLAVEAHPHGHARGGREDPPTGTGPTEPGVSAGSSRSSESLLPAGSEHSHGTPHVTWSCILRPPAAVECCTRSTSGCSPTSWSTS